MSAAVDTQHDAGGRMKLGLMPGVIGEAYFAGKNGEHRLWLSRHLSGAEGDPFVLWIGMNPSVATAEIDDLTVRKEWHWTAEWGFRRMVKCNVGTYRATDPRVLSDPRVNPCHSENVPTIVDFAGRAARVILSTGQPPDPLLPHAHAAVRALRARKVAMHCFGVTAQGWPRHTSRLAYATPLVEYDG